MQVTVLLIDGEFLAFDKDGAMITDRNILQQIAFEPYEGTFQIEDIQVDNDVDDAILQSIEINLTHNTQR
jgi:hypothetical protein